MKYKLIITDKETGKKQQSDFMDIGSLEQHLHAGKVNGWWGREAYTITHPEKTIVIPDTLDENGNILIEGSTQIIPAREEFVPASYEIEILNVEAEYNANELKKAKKQSAKVLLENIDWENVKKLEDVIAIVQALVEKDLV